jgi:uncharacterized membrane protein
MTSVTRIALAAGLAGMLTLAAAASPAQNRMEAHSESGYGAGYCVPPSTETAEEQRVYCEGWRAVRKSW